MILNSVKERERRVCIDEHEPLENDELADEFLSKYARRYSGGGGTVTARSAGKMREHYIPI